MQIRRLIIDGYSLLYRFKDKSRVSSDTLATLRQQLIRQIEEQAGGLADRITVVFDGQGPRAEKSQESDFVEIIYSPVHQTADTVIERLVSEDPEPQRIMVVSSDSAERMTVVAAGAQTLSCGDFFTWCQSKSKRFKRQSGHNKEGTTLGDYFPTGKNDGRGAG